METYTLTFTEQEMGLLNQAIGELPHKFAVPLIQSINEQIMKAQAEAAKENSPETQDGKADGKKAMSHASS